MSESVKNIEANNCSLACLVGSCLKFDLDKKRKGQLEQGIQNSHGYLCSSFNFIYNFHG